MKRSHAGGAAGGGGERPEAAARLALAVGALAYAAAVLIASAEPGARAWGVHLSGFLSGGPRLFVLTLILGGAGAMALGALGTRRPDRDGGAHGESRSRAARGVHPPAWLLLLPAAGLLWALRTRTHFLGDGVVWLAGLRADALLAESEPLAKTLWLGVAALIRALGQPVEASSVALFPVALGLLAGAILWGLAAEIARGVGRRRIAFGLLATLGISQLYFGYIESYPPAAVATLLYLWLALRRLRGVGSPLLPAGALAVAVASHLSALYLVPSFAYLALRGPTQRWRGAVLLVATGGATTALLLALGYRPVEWSRALGIAAHAAGSAGGVERLAKPYAALSPAHAGDVANALLLILPAPTLLLVARAATWRPRSPLSLEPPAALLTLAAVPGALLAALLVLPVPAAQDWDLTALFWLPAAVLGVRAGLPLLGQERRRGGWGERWLSRGLASVALGALLSFVLVNADRGAGVRRFRTLLGPDAAITPFGRAYGFSILAEHFEDREEHAAALRYAREALDADPANPRYWVKVGAALYSLDRYEEAIPVLEEAVRRGPTRGDAKHNLGLCYMRQRRYREGLDLFRAAVALDGDRPDWRHNLGVAYINTGQPDSAHATWTSLLRRWPDYPLTVRSMLRHFGDAGSHDARNAPAPDRSRGSAPSPP